MGRAPFLTARITDHLNNGGGTEVAQRMAGHRNAKTTGLYDRRDLYDRRNDDISLGEGERIGIWGLNPLTRGKRQSSWKSYEQTIGRPRA